MSSEDPTQNPSMLHGHATYVAGAAKVFPPLLPSPLLLPANPTNMWIQEAFGFESGSSDKEYAVNEMRAAKEQSEGEPKHNETAGKIEEKLGSVTGCEGMVGEGKERQA